jgi:membrane fusion protein, multidrug efflux system
VGRRRPVEGASACRRRRRLNGDNWFINDGLKAGERIVVDGAIRVAPDVALKIVGTVASTETGGKTIVEQTNETSAFPEGKPAGANAASGATPASPASQ